MAGSYSYVADSALTCSIVPVAGGATQCDCDPPYRYEGTLQISVGAEKNASGTRYRDVIGRLTFRACRDDWTPRCQSEQTVTSIDSGAGPQTNVPNVLMGSSLHMTFGVRTGGLPDDQWYHQGSWSGTTISGRHERWDGSSQGCGHDRGAFTATRLSP